MEPMPSPPFHCRAALSALLVLLCAAAPAAAQPPEPVVQRIMAQEVTDVFHRFGVSRDGRVVVGHLIGFEFDEQFQSHRGTDRPARWTLAGGVEILEPRLAGFATAASDDGRFIAGVFDPTSDFAVSNPDAMHPFVWSSETGLRVLPRPPGAVGFESMAPRDVSSDGQAIITNSGYLWREGNSSWFVTAVDCPSGTPRVQSMTPNGRSLLGPCALSDTIFFGERGSPLAFLSPAWIGTMGRSLSDDALRIAYSTGDPWEAGSRPRIFDERVGTLDLPLLPGSTSCAVHAISGNGTVAGGSCWSGTPLDSRATLWFDGQPVDLASLTGRAFRSISVLSTDGLRMVASDDPGGQIGAWYVDLCSIDDDDEDGDGLLDGWETDGICYPGLDGQIHRYLLDADGDGISDAHPRRKDLFVEIDVMSGVDFGDEEMGLVAASFAAAPVANPDGSSGIRLHWIVEQDAFPFEPLTLSSNGFPPDAAEQKELRFGTPLERTDPNAPLLLAAKARAYRYAMAYHRVELADGGSVGGVAEMPGDDMVLYLEGFADVVNRAATLMHELGHNLGLDHGGGDEINGKPNYVSIMNYTYADRMPWNEEFWQLDFSREELAPLDESSLDETVSVGAGGSGLYSDHFMPFFSIIAEGSCFEELLWGSTVTVYASLAPTATNDFNQDCDHADQGVAIDLNFPHADVVLPGAEDGATPGEVLYGWNDWANLSLPVQTGGGAFFAPAASQEPTLEQIDYVRQNFPPPPPRVCDIDGNRRVDGDDVSRIVDAMGMPVGSDEPTLDVDGSGAIDEADVHFCLARCDQPMCVRPHGPRACGLGAEILLAVGAWAGARRILRWRRARRSQGSE